MRTLVVFTTLAAAFSCSVAAGCSSASSGPSGLSDGGPGSFTGVVPCSAHADAGTDTCALSMPLSGGISIDLGANGCGSEFENILGFVDYPVGPGDDVGVQILFPGSTVPVDQTGTFSTTIAVTRSHADGGFEIWQTPDAACTVTIAGSICSPTSLFPWRRVLDGSGACTQPAAPKMGTSGAPITIGKFTYEGFIDPTM